MIFERGTWRPRLRRQGQGLYRGHGRAVVHRAGLGRRRAGRCRRRADEQARLRPSLCGAQPRARHRTGREAEGGRAVSGLARCSSPIPAPRPTTPRSSSSGTPTTRSAGRRRKRSSAAAKAYHGVTIASASLTRPAGQSHELRPAARFRALRRVPALLPRRRTGRERGRLHRPPGRRSRESDRRGRPRHHRRHDRRALDGRRRRHHAARRAISRR